MPRTSYYSIDDFLAAEEVVPCTTLFDFSYLSHLDPDAHLAVPMNSIKEQQQYVLPENSKLKLPLWALHKWASLSFCRLSVPRTYHRRVRELLAADPVHVTALGDYFFDAGKLILGLCESSAASAMGRRSNQHSSTLLEECRSIRESLVTAYTGPRLRRTLDWALCAGTGEHDSNVLLQLTSLERRLYHAGALAQTQFQVYKQFSNPRLVIKATQRQSCKVTDISTAKEPTDNRPNKRIRAL